MSNETRQHNSFIHALSKIFHPAITYFCSGCDRNMEPVTEPVTVLRPRHTELVPLAMKFSGDIFLAAVCVVYARHERSDDGKLSHISLDVCAQVPKGIFTRIILQVLLRDPDTDEIIEIIDYQPKYESTAESAPPSESSQDAGQACGIQHNPIIWDWQHELDPRRRGSPYQSYGIWVKAANKLKAEFRLECHWKDGIIEEKRLSPSSSGAFYKRLLRLEDDDIESRVMRRHEE